MPKKPISRGALEALLLAEVRKRPGCETVERIVVAPVSPPRHGINWRVSHCAPGGAAASKVARAIIDIEEDFATEYDLIHVV